MWLDALDSSGRSPLALAVARRNESPTAYKLFPDSLLIALMPPSLSKKRCFDYDTDLHSSIRSVLYKIIEPSLTCSSELSTLHTLPKVQQLLQLHTDLSLRPAHAGRMIYNKRYRTADLSSLGFRSALGLFVDGVLAPLLYGRPSGGPLVYQSEPTLRVQFPGQPSIGRAHIDYGYGRQAGEVNCWLPITRVGPGNTLHAETTPGGKDFEPFEADWGTAVLFWGSQCEHHSEENDGKIGTRVSLDFRIIREDHFIKYYVPPNRLQAKGEVEDDHFANMKIGEHYTTTLIEREWRESQEAKKGADAETPPPPPPLTTKDSSVDINPLHVVELQDAKQCSLS